MEASVISNVFVCKCNDHDAHTVHLTSLGLGQAHPNKKTLI